MLYKIYFLIKSKADKKIILLFILEKFKFFYEKNKKKAEKKYSSKILKTKKITSDFFSQNSFLFYYSLRTLKKPFSYLEIGSYEGASAIFTYKKFNPKEIYCVDIWKKTSDGYQEKNFNIIEKNFDKNIKSIKSIKKIKKTSDSFFKKNRKKFDAIYIDGYHHASQVFKDCVNAWKFLNINGVLICDDYIWDHYKKISNNPCFAINKFLNKIKNEYIILKISNSQISIKKVNKIL